MRHCEEASRDRVSTIKPRHLEIALHSIGKGATTSRKDDEQHEEEGIEVQGGGIITITHVKSMARSHAKMAITDEVTNLLFTYGDMVSSLNPILKACQSWSRPDVFH